MVHHYYTFVDQRLKDAYLVHLCHEAERAGQTTAIFTRSVSETRRVSRLLDTLKICAVSLQCDLSPSARTASLDKIRRKECHAIVTTDAAATLGPILNVDRIINFSLTWRMNLETYTKRIGNIVRSSFALIKLWTYLWQNMPSIWIRSCPILVKWKGPYLKTLR
ncbi:hypothetical protein B0I37DRAFT_350887 [Chaetomium sp. MPI-CAGE-AT-0009]|nr:hypothetical protein B0I37DRAFT_350887 [Chaetomium sp. MPI-CAGE-AT-0009]